MEREIERNAILHIPPRTPPILPVIGSTSSPIRSQHSAPSLRRRRSTSPTPSMASVSTMSSTRSTASATRSGPLHAAISRLTPSRVTSGTRQPSPLPAPPVTSSSVGMGVLETPGHTAPIVTTPSTPSIPVVRTTQPGFDYPTEPSTEELLATCHAFIDRLRTGSSALVVQRLNSVGPMPTDKALVAFWIAQVGTALSSSSSSPPRMPLTACL